MTKELIERAESYLHVQGYGMAQHEIPMSHDIIRDLLAALPKWHPLEELPEELKDFTEILVGWWEYPDPENPIRKESTDGWPLIDPNTDVTKPFWRVALSQYEDLGYRRGFRHRNGACEATHYRLLSTPPSDHISAPSKLVAGGE